MSVFRSSMHAEVSSSYQLEEPTLHKSAAPSNLERNNFFELHNVIRHLESFQIRELSTSKQLREENKGKKTGDGKFGATFEMATGIKFSREKKVLRIAVDEAAEEALEYIRSATSWKLDWSIVLP